MPKPSTAPEGDDVFIPAPTENPVVNALRETGLYVGSLADQRHELTCPWKHEHGDANLGPATYKEPTMLTPAGSFDCPHQHADRVTIDKLLDRLNVSPVHARCKPRIRIVGGEMLRILHSAERALASLGDYYQSGGAIVTVNRTENGDSAVTLVNDNLLTKALAQAADWEKYDGRTKGWRVCDPTPQLVKQLLNAQNYDHLPVLSGIARQPYFRKQDGVLVTNPGYDANSGIYGSFDNTTFGATVPTEAAARAALAELDTLLNEFHFASRTDRSAAIGAIVTAAARSSLPVAPAFNITASTPGSGKSYLASLIASFAGPGEPLNLSYPTTTEEASKSMLAALLARPAVISFDDMQTDWVPFGMINRMLTSETVADRVLGASRTIQVSTNTFVMGTGNNVGPVRDMCRRVVTIGLQPQTSAPATLRYAGRPVERVKADRARYVTLALTIIQAWQAAHRPRTDVADIATFGNWSDMVRQPLLWLGEPDPATSLIEQVNTDPDAETLARFTAAWRERFAGRIVTLRQIVDHAEHQNAELLDALMELPVADHGRINRSKLGWYLKRNANRIVQGRQICKEVNSERNAWSVQIAGTPSNERASSLDRGDKTASMSLPSSTPLDPNPLTEIDGEIY